MNIDVIGRIRKSVRNEGPTKLEVGSNNRITNRAGGQTFAFDHLYHQDAANVDVFARHVEPLIDAFIAGYNSCFICFGESDSGKSYTLAGDSSHRSGIIPLAIANMFNKIEPGEQFLHTKKVQTNNTLGLKMQMFEIYNERIRDLLIIPVSNQEVLNLDATAEDGVHVKGISSINITKAATATTNFREGWNRRLTQMTDYGPADNQSAIVVQFELMLAPHNDLLSNRSKITFVDMPGAEKLIFDSTNIRMREGPTLNRGIMAFSQVVAELANSGSANRVINYTDAVLTKLISDELGGNCKTRVLVNLKPHPQADVLGAVLRTSSQISQIKNYPIINDAYAQGLVTQYCAKIIKLQEELGVELVPGGTQTKEVREELRRVQTENLELRDKNERLLYRMEQLQGKYGVLAHSKTDVSTQLLSTEEERLKVSKALVEMEIENNRLKEDVETVKFEMSNKVLKLENDLLELQLQRDRFYKQAMRADEIEHERKDLADEYVTLKSNFMEMNREMELLRAKNEEISMELLNMVNSKATLLRQMENMELASMGITSDHNAEVERVKAMIGRVDRRPSTVKSLKPLKEEMNTERKMLASRGQVNREIEGMRNQYDNDQAKLRQKIGTLINDLQESRQLAKDRLSKISNLSAQLISIRNEKEQMESQHNRMQHKLRDMYEEYRNRLVKYVEDVADYIDANRANNLEQMRDYVAQMLVDIKKAHKSREDQLSQAAQNFKKRMLDIVKRYEELLVAYIHLRQQVVESNYSDIQVGPDITTLTLTDSELTSNSHKEIVRLQSELDRTRNELDSLKLQTRLQGGSQRETAKDKGNKGDAIGPEGIQHLRKQVKEFTMNTQRDLEVERAQLIARNQMLEEQLKESQDYIEKHLVRYKDEIFRLRKKLGHPENMK